VRKVLICPAESQIIGCLVHLCAGEKRLNLGFNLIVFSAHAILP